MNQVPLLSLEGLRDHQQRALFAWQQQHATSAVFRAWAEVYRAWNGVDGEQQEVWLGHAAVLWQELNVTCEGQNWLPLLNQFVQVSFRGIARKTPRDFAPPLAADAASWHNVFGTSVQQLSTGTSQGATLHGQVGETELLFDAMLAQYATVFAKRIAKNNRAVLQVQLDQLDRARRCQQSELLLVQAVNWQADASAAPPLLDLLAEIMLIAPQAPSVPHALLPEGRSEVLAVAQLLGFWARRAPWFHEGLMRYAPNVLPPAPVAPPPSGTALPAVRGCDQHAVIVANHGVRRWLFASDAACPAVSLHGLGIDLGQLRAQWQSGAPTQEAVTTPQMMAICEPSAMCRVMCWELPAAYYQSQTNAAELAPDAAMVRLCDDIITSQRPGCVIALFDQRQLQSPQGVMVIGAYVAAATKLAQHMRNAGVSSDGVHWFIVFDGVDPTQLGPQLPGEATAPDPLLLADYQTALRGSASEGLVSAFGNSADSFVNAALAHPICRGSLAFSHRVASDLNGVQPLLNAFGHYGFNRIHVAYTGSNPAEAASWASFSQVWVTVRKALAANSFYNRKAFLEQELVAQLLDHTSPRGQSGGIGHTLPVILSALANAGQGSSRQSEASLSAMWQDLVNRVGVETFSSANFESLWMSGEAARISQNALATNRLESLSKVLAMLLAELGIPDQSLSSFVWSAERAPTTEAAPTDAQWQQLVELASKPQPVLPEDETLLALSQFHTGYDAVMGSLSHHCLLKDFGPETATASILYEHGSTPLTRLLIEPSVELDSKTRLLMSLRGYAMPAWRAKMSFNRGERDALKYETLRSIWRDVLIADLLLVHLLRLSARAGIALAIPGNQASGKWNFRRSQLLRLLDTGGWNAEKAGEDPQAFFAALERLIDLWKDFYKNRGPHRTKQRTARVDSLKEEYEQLRKPMTVPALHADLSTDKAQEFERSAYLAAYIVELVARVPHQAAGAGSETGAAEAFDVDEYCAKAKTLIDQYLIHKGRYLVRHAAYQLEAAQWLRGYGPQVELVGRDVLAAPQVAPAQLAQRIASAVNVALQEEEARIAAGGRGSVPPHSVPPPPPAGALPSPMGGSGYPPPGGLGYQPSGGHGFPPPGGSGYPPPGGHGYPPPGGPGYPPPGGPPAPMPGGPGYPPPGGPGYPPSGGPEYPRPASPPSRPPPPPSGRPLPPPSGRPPPPPSRRRSEPPSGGPAGAPSGGPSQQSGGPSQQSGPPPPPTPPPKFFS